LLDGRPLPAGELARIAGLTPNSASGHLARLIEGKLVSVEREGRHRYYRLTSPTVATVIEDLAELAERPLTLTQPTLSRAARALRQARRCYNHLAGALAVEIAHALEARDYIRRGEGKRYELDGEAGRQWFAGQGVNFDNLKAGRYGLARQCLDWTERR